MKKITSRILIATVAIIAVAVSCTNVKNKDASTTAYEANDGAVYPSIDGAIPYLVTVEDRGELEATQKVQVVVGKTMEVDCNQHGLSGSFEDKTLEGYGYNYYVFNTDGNVVSTLMACPDDTKTMKFVSGEDRFIPYNSKLTTPVYAPEGYEVKYTLWSADDSKDASLKPEESVNKDAASQLKHFPAEIENYDRYVIYLAEQDDEQSLRLEVTPGITKEVDCNRHWLAGDMKTEEVKGMGYNYMVFESDGNIASTRMACPDNELTKKFIAGQSDFGRYNSKLPYVIFVPKGMEVKYNIWKAGDTVTAEKM